MRTCILVGTAQAREDEVASALAKLEGVHRAFAVVGRPEVVVMAEVESLGGVVRLVDSLSRTEGVLVSETLLEIPVEAMGRRP